MLSVICFVLFAITCQPVGCEGGAIDHGKRQCLAILCDCPSSSAPTKPALGATSAPCNILDYCRAPIPQKINYMSGPCDFIRPIVPQVVAPAPDIPICQGTTPTWMNPQQIDMMLGDTNTPVYAPQQQPAITIGQPCLDLISTLLQSCGGLPAAPAYQQVTQSPASSFGIAGTRPMAAPANSYIASNPILQYFYQPMTTGQRPAGPVSPSAMGSSMGGVAGVNTGGGMSGGMGGGMIGGRGVSSSIGDTGQYYPGTGPSWGTKSSSTLSDVGGSATSCGNTNLGAKVMNHLPCARFSPASPTVRYNNQMMMGGYMSALPNQQFGY